MNLSTQIHPDPGDGTLEELFKAVEDEDPERVSLLLSKNQIDLNKPYSVEPDNMNMTVLHLAVALNLPEIVEILLKYKADPNSKASEEGFSPLHVSVVQDLPEIIQMLIKAGGNPWMKGEKDGKTCFDLMEDANMSHLLRALTIDPGRQSLATITEEEGNSTANISFFDGVSPATSKTGSFFTCQSSSVATENSSSIMLSQNVVEQSSISQILGFSSAEGIKEQDTRAFMTEDSMSMISISSAIITPPHSFITIDDSTNQTKSEPSATDSSNDSLLSPSPRPLTQKELETLRSAAAQHGIPVLPNTVNILSKFIDTKTKVLNLSPTKYTSTHGYSDELDFAIRNIAIIEHWKGHHVDFRQDLKIPNKTSKGFFNYLLLDPYIIKRSNFSGNHLRTSVLHNKNKFETFLKSVFYIGKGSGTRPLQHLVDAKTRYTTQQRRRLPDSTKLDKVVSIWEKGQGVVVLSIFHHSPELEVNVNEAAMIDAIGLGCDHLTNLKKGSYINTPAATWPQKKKNQFGSFLLHKAFCLFVVEDHWKTFYPKDV